MDLSDPQLSDPLLSDPHLSGRLQESLRVPILSAALAAAALLRWSVRKGLTRRAAEGPEAAATHWGDRSGH